MKDFLEIVQGRKSVRSFISDPVPTEIIEKIISVAVMAPTNCNQQLWNFIVIDDPVVRERLVKEAAGNTLFRRVPTLIALTYDGWNYKEAMQGASLALGHLLLAATYYGVSASPVNSYGSDKKVKKVLGIPDHQVICCFITLGYPDDKATQAPPVPRKLAEEVMHRNRFEPKLRAPFTYNPNDWSLDQLRLHQQHYCRKTSLGKEMDLAGNYERLLVQEVLRDKTGPFLDLMSYDGSYLSLFPAGELYTLDLSPEIAAYTKEAASLASRSIKFGEIYNAAAELLPGSPQTITLIYKAERLSQAALQRLCEQAYATLPAGGKLIIIARRRPSLFYLFLSLLKLKFGDDTRKTGIYAFFGPYWPVQVSKIITAAKQARFERITWHGYFAFPAFFEQVYQMVVQYIRSGGSSYLHRDRKRDWVSRSIDAVLAWQGFKRCGVFGSVVVITCKKD